MAEIPFMATENSNEIEQLQQKKTISLIGTLKINKYLNTESINMIIEDMK